MAKLRVFFINHLLNSHERGSAPTYCCVTGNSLIKALGLCPHNNMDIVKVIGLIGYHSNRKR